MRCRNCGWENPAERQKCEKCNAPLIGSMIEDSTPLKRKNYTSVAENLKGTVPENADGIFIQKDKAGGNVPFKCTNCGYPVSSAMNVCPNCGKMLKDKTGANLSETRNVCRECGRIIPTNVNLCLDCEELLQRHRHINEPYGGTVNSWEMPQQGTFCTLKPIAWREEKIFYNPISYSGTTIQLNRANTDPNNNTITSKVQAVLIREGGSWYIEDKSEQHTTFIRVGKRMKLENGDVIVLGNRLFEFKE